MVYNFGNKCTLHPSSITRSKGKYARRAAGFAIALTVLGLAACEIAEGNFDSAGGDGGVGDETDRSPTIKGVTVKPGIAAVGRSVKQKFTASVEGDVTASLDWSVTGNTDSKTAIDGNGLLTVGGGEQSRTLTVKGQAGTKYGTAFVMIVGNEEYPEEHGISLSPGVVTVGRNIPQTFSALLSANGEAAASVTWNVSGSLSNGTVITSGVLAVAGDEAAKSLTVRASAGGLYGTAIVYIAESGGAPPAGEGPYPSNLGLAVTPLEVTLDKGGSPQEFTAAGVEPNTVTWRLTGGTDTNISGSTVTVGGNETAEKITVRAEAGSLSGTAVIRVRGNESEPVVVNNGIRIEPAAANVAPGTSRVFGAYDSINESSAAVTWQVTGGGSGTSVNGGGKLEVALEEKAAYLTLRAEMSGGRYGTAAVKVTHESGAPVNLPVPVNNGITVIPGIITLAKGGQGTSFTALDGDGSPAEVSWTLEASGTLANGTAIDEAGLLSVGSGQDTGYITVRADGDDEVYGTAIVYINDTGEGHPFDGGIAVSPGSVEAAAGGQIDFTAKLSGTDALAPVTWSLDPGGNGESMIDSDTGRLTLGAEEESDTVLVVRAVKSDGRYGTARVTVTNQNPVVTSVTVSPDAQTIPRGGKYQFIANVEVQYGASSDVGWSIETSVKTGTSVEGGLVTVAADETPGTFTIRATSTADENKYDEAVITVPAPAEVTLVTVSPAGAVVMPGNGKQFNATVWGTGSPAQTVSWTVSGGTNYTGINESGYLTVAIGETAASLTVKATSIENPDKYGEALVYTSSAWVDVTSPGDNTGDYLAFGVGQDGKFYVGGHGNEGNPTTNSYGIRQLDTATGNLLDTAITTGSYYDFGMGQDNKLYAGGLNTGIKRLKEDGQWENTNITSGTYFSFGMGQDNKLYAESYRSGIKRLELNSESTNYEWVNTNITEDTYYGFGMGQDGKLYAGSSGNGIKRLELNSESDNYEWVDTDINSGSYLGFGMGQDGKLYAASSGNGIKRLNDSGQLEDTNINSGTYRYFGMGQDDKLYVGDYNDYIPSYTSNAGYDGYGIKRLELNGASNNYEWVNTNISTGYYHAFGIGPDGKLYTGGWGKVDGNWLGIKRLE